MTATTPGQAHKILTDRRLMEPPPVPALIRKASRQSGARPGRILREIARMALRKGGMSQHEYFANHLYRTDLTMEEKREFLGEKGCYYLNLRLSPPDLTRMRGFLNDKITHTALWTQFGLPTTVTRAVYSRDRWLGRIETLRDAAAIADYLAAQTDFPLFGKPVEGLQALGTMRIEGVDAKAGAGSGQVRLADGREVGLMALAEEIVRDYPEGYMFQDVVTQHPALTALAGPALSTVRFVTVIADETPEVLYTSWKLASPDAMSDNFWQEGSMLARVDPATGVVDNCIIGKGPDEEWVETHPVSGKPINGFRMPHWQAAVDLAIRAHSIYPVNGCLGWDVAIGPDGPVMIECNDNPGHEFYQLVNKTGILASEKRAVLDRVIARSKRLWQDRKARVYKTES